MLRYGHSTGLNNLLFHGYTDLQYLAPILRHIECRDASILHLEQKSMTRGIVFSSSLPTQLLCTIYALDMTPQARILLSVYPENKV